jgi:hypothetical protein
VDTLGSINEKTRRVYNLAAEKYHSFFHDEMKEKEYDRKLLDALGKKFAPGSLIADSGCGPSGHIGRYLFDKLLAGGFAKVPNRHSRRRDPRQACRKKNSFSNRQDAGVAYSYDA